jgi:hypothetical protein
VYDPDEQDQPPGEVDWDAWEKNRFSGRGRWWLLLMVVSMAAMTALYFQSDGTFIPWGPPSK